jgi:hypothetical protein
MANPTLEDVIKAVQAIMRTVDGIRDAQDQIPDSENIEPFTLCYPNSGTYEQQSVGDVKALHTLTLDVMVARQDSKRSYQEVIPYVDRVALALLKKPTLNGTVQNFGPPSYTWMQFNYAGIDYVGWRFVIPGIKLRFTW